MKAVNVYLTFDGNCQKAFEFYKRCLGGELFTMKFADMPGGCDKLPPGSGDRVMHTALKNGAAVLMASDTMPGMPFHQGNNFSVAITCESNEDVDKYCGALSQGGKVTMPSQETFWAHRFAMCTDQFGIQWMFNHDKPMQM
jgi:PhnB protein